MAFRYSTFAPIVFFSLLSLVQTNVHLIGDLLHGSGMTTIPKGIYSSVKILNLINNDFSNIQPHVFVDNGFPNLEKALLRENNIKHIQPNAFATLPNLLQLDLYGNALTTIQNNTFVGLDALQHLHLGHNAITSIDKDVLQPLKSLETLDLSENSLTDLDEHLLTSSRIIELDLKGNALKLNKRETIQESSFLKRLYLQSCNLAELSSTAFLKLPNLETLDLSNNKLKKLPSGLLGKLSLLHYLDISFNMILRISTNVFYLPTNLDVIFCEGNPLQTGSDCKKLLVTLQNNTMDVTDIVEVTDQARTTSSGTYFQETISGSKNVVTIFTEDNDEDGTTRNNFDYSATEEAIGRYPTIKSTDVDENIDNVLIYSIIAASCLCLVLVIILLAQVVYLMRLYSNDRENIFFDI